MVELALSNYREWLPFAIIALGVLLAMISPFMPHKREHHQKAMKKVSGFRSALQSHDIEHWKELYKGTGDKIDPPKGYFIDGEGKPTRLDSMWTAGGEDHTSIQRIAESLEKLCGDFPADSYEVKVVWYEIGQLLSSMHEWLQQIEGVQENSSFLEEQYPNIYKIYAKYQPKFKRWPYRIYAKR